MQLATIRKEPTYNPDSAIVRYTEVRALTEKLCDPLVTEDFVVQSMPEVSPTKWHLAHTSWFFETFLLKPHLAGYEEFNSHFGYLFNSYYNAMGDRHCRQNRGQLSRPSVEDIYAYRKHVDSHMGTLLRATNTGTNERLSPLLEIGLHHEQQHQELMLTDIKHVFWVNPLRPAYRTRPTNLTLHRQHPLHWRKFSPGLTHMGHDGTGFAFDNEEPRHKVFVAPFELSSRLVTNGEYKEFISDGGYTSPEHWLSLGWATVQGEDWNAPLYWVKQDGIWFNHTLSGFRPVDDQEPVCHLSYLEADAYARWAGVRLPTEAEWETASSHLKTHGTFIEADTLHPSIAQEGDFMQQMFGDLWQWTSSSYSPYPGYRAPDGALGEYNGKFMCNQYVLRGGSVATSKTHIRHTYRNFFPPATRWQFSGLRLARNV